MGDRIWQVDALRGGAVLGMILYHLAFSLYFFGNFPIPIFHWSFEAFQTLVAGTFLILVGVSASMKFKRLKEKGSSWHEVMLNFSQRSLKIFTAGMLVTLATLLLLPEYFVRFGVLHLIGVSTLLVIPLLSRPRAALAISILLLFIRVCVPQMPTGNLFTLWLGFIPENFWSLDYFPVIPWFGLVAFGTVLEKKLRFPKVKDPTPWLTWIGRHALIIYLGHQPVVLLLVLLIRSRL